MAVKSIRQLAYVCNVGSFNDTLDFWHRTFDAGPFWVTDVEPAEQIYDGRPTSSAWRLAVGRTRTCSSSRLLPLEKRKALVMILIDACHRIAYTDGLASRAEEVSDQSHVPGGR